MNCDLMGEAAVAQTAGVEQAATCASSLCGYKCALVHLFNRGSIQVPNIHLINLLKQLFHLKLQGQNTAFVYFNNDKT